MASVVDGNGGSGGLVVTELGHIKELVTQLEVHLSGSSPDLCKQLASQISSITERSISLLITTSTLDGARKRSAATASPLSDASDAPFVMATKKRKTTKKKKKKNHEVRVSTAGGDGDHPADDGHSWRKYGQKEILGAKHPRGYYRCTHRHSQGCAATKQVQRTDEDPTFFDVVYLGDHTCVQSQRASAAAGQAAADAQAPEYKYNANPGASSLLQSLSSSLTVKAEGPAVEPEQKLLQGWDAPAPFCFSSTPATASGCLVPERSPFSAPSTSDNWGVSPATSDSNRVVSFPPFEATLYRSSSCGDDVQFGFEEVMSALDRPDGFLDDLDIDISSFFA
ncbi:transcription factor WRKY19-like [Miscanthus floridulus]|uniref:transcription factor WRKY19-like n=1 Tax=Miscanthus floridulus TaxID=154761 RepID=UPI00345A434F